VNSSQEQLFFLDFRKEFFGEELLFGRIALEKNFEEELSEEELIVNQLIMSILKIH
jgi:hypothetical protein